MAQEVTVGGYTDPARATERIQDIADQVKAEVEKTIKKKLPVYEAMLFRQQVVAGMNYVIMIYVGRDECINAQVFEQLQCDGGKFVLIKVTQHRISPLEPLQ